MTPFTPAPPEWSAEQMIEDFDNGGVATGVLSMPQPGIWWGGRDRTRAVARESNEYNATLMSDYPGRFGMFAAVPGPTDIDGSLLEVEYVYDVLNADGLGMKTNYHKVGNGTYFEDQWLGDPAFAPLYEELNRRNAVIYTHPQDAACCLGLVPNINRVAVEYQTNTSRTIWNLLMTGTAARYPNITWIFSHGGGTVPFLIQRLLGVETAAYLRDGGALAEGATQPSASEELPRGALYELQRFYYDTAATSNPVSMSALRNVVPVSQIVFGSDNPYGQPSAIANGLEVSGVFNAQELQAINHENMARVLPRYA